MPNFAHDADIVVVGAGAAGLAAAHRLREHPVSVLVLEAGGRIGGRGHTLQHASGWPLELGCGWLHSGDVNPWTRIVEEIGLTVDRCTPPWGTQWEDRGFSPAEQRAFHAARDAFEARLAAAAAEEGEDRAAADFFEPGGRWNPLIDAVSAYVNGVEHDRLSVRDHANYADTGVNWRVVEGFGTAIARLGANAPVMLDTAVTMIDHAGPRLVIETSRGTVTARSVIVTVSSNVLAQERLRFRPALPDKADAAGGVPLGYADKLFLALDGADELPVDAHLYGATDRTQTASYHIRPFGRPLIEAYFGGAHARSLEAEGEAAFAAHAVEELSRLLGGEMRRRLTPLVASIWGREPFIGGSYSYALPGRTASRAALAQPVDDRLFFAGEACSTHDFSTAHGAFSTGVAAADQALLALRRPAEVMAAGVGA